MDAAKVKVVNLTIATNRRVYMDLLGIPFRLNHLTIRKSFVSLQQPYTTVNTQTPIMS